MKRNRTLLAISILAGCLALAAGAAAAPGDQLSPLAPKQVPQERPGLQRPGPTPMPQPLKCPDLKVTDIQVALLGTELGKPGVEFPRDRVRVTFTVKNVGNATAVTTAPPPGSGPIVLQLNSFRNDTSLVGTVFQQIPAGGSVTARVEDTFVHGQKTTYRGTIVYGAAECRTDNNDLAAAVDEIKLHPAQGLPDLVPVNTWPIQGEHGYCKLNNNRLEVTVRNQGTAPAALSTLKVALSNGKTTAVPVSSLPAGGAAVHVFDLPANCFSSPDCSFTIAVDSGGVVTESNEGNNSAHGRCFPY